MKNYRSAKQLILDINRIKPKVISYKGHFLTLVMEENKYMEKIGNEYTENFIEVDEFGRVITINIGEELIEETYENNNKRHTFDMQDIIDYILKYRTGCRETAKIFNTTPATISYYIKKANNEEVNKIMKEKKNKTAKNVYDYTSEVMGILDKITKGEWRITPLTSEQAKAILEKIEEKIIMLNRGVEE